MAASTVLLTFEQVGERIQASHMTARRRAIEWGMTLINVGTQRRPRLRVAEDELARHLKAHGIDTT